MNWQMDGPAIIVDSERTSGKQASASDGANTMDTSEEGGVGRDDIKGQRHTQEYSDGEEAMSEG